MLSSKDLPGTSKHREVQDMEIISKVMLFGGQSLYFLHTKDDPLYFISLSFVLVYMEMLSYEVVITVHDL